jgi:cytochrome P450
LRELARVHFDPVSGVFFVLGHREFSLLARSSDLGRDTRLWTNSWSTPENRERDPVGYALFSELQPQMTNANPPDHRRMRAVYEAAFRPAYLARFGSSIEEECRRVLDTIPVACPFDFMTAFAKVLPGRVSLRMFGLPDEIESDLARWVEALSLIGNIFVTPKQKADAHQALREFKLFLRGHLKQAEDDGFLAMARASLAEGIMDEEESLNNLVTLIAGGTATQTLLGNGLVTLLRHPDQLQTLRTKPSLMEGAVEEMLRYEPGGSFILRVAIRDVELDGRSDGAWSDGGHQPRPRSVSRSGQLQHPAIPESAIGVRRRAPHLYRQGSSADDGPDCVHHAPGPFPPDSAGRRARLVGTPE